MSVPLNPPMEPSELEKRAEEIAQRAVEWAHAESGGRTASWDQMSAPHRAGMVGAALTHLSFEAALKPAEEPK